MSSVYEDLSVLCLACAGGALGYCYQLSRQTKPLPAAELGNLYAQVISEKVNDCLSLSEKIMGEIAGHMPAKLKDEVEMIIGKETFKDKIWKFVREIRDWFGDQVKSVAKQINWDELSWNLKRNKLLIVFTCTGFLAVYCTVTKFRKTAHVTIRRQGQISRSNEQFTNPLELLFGYCLYQTRRLTNLVRTSPIACYFAAVTVIGFLIKTFVVVEYYPEIDVCVVKIKE